MIAACPLRMIRSREGDSDAGTGSGRTTAIKAEEGSLGPPRVTRSVEDRWRAGR